ncbi:glycoside hydrolase family 47 protein [Tenuifilum thalassicum]|uniref:Glycoside hydrolase family 47 protein n=1 Tax=Tenuifilum thalassicum TaxID=2590900 RepID=A0A7D4CQ62_9BACT|nr:glycoside hydrolase family 47 protein [Tenuifilum thalassicum]QKG79225.1 glycoside hydrolase family 47 protein [Tenuifilum thalassicum]
MAKSFSILIFIYLVVPGISKNTIGKPTDWIEKDSTCFAPDEVKLEMERCWSAYKSYAWGFDVLHPLSKKGSNWYGKSIGISPIDAYSTLAVMGFEKEAKEVEDYALTLSWDQDIYVQVFEVNIRVLGGLLAIYENTRNEEILKKAIDLGNRLLRAFNSPTGIPYHSVNLKTGKTSGPQGEGKGNIVNTAQAASYLFEFGILSYYSQDPRYYQAAFRATKAIFERYSEIGLPGDFIDVESGKWVNNWSYLQAGVDSYFEYLLKSYLLFHDKQVKNMWEFSLKKIKLYYTDEYQGKLFYACVNMHTGEIVKRSISLYDAFFPAALALYGDIELAEKSMETWDWLWDKFGLLPTRYMYSNDSIEYSNSELNPEIVESAYYLYSITGKPKYKKMICKYWSDMVSCCRNSVAFNAVEDVRTKKPKDLLETYFYAETLKYFYLSSLSKDQFNFEDYIFNTEAHFFKKSNFDSEKAKLYLGIQQTGQ